MSFWRRSPNLKVGDKIDGYRVIAVRMMVSPSVAVVNHGQRRHGLPTVAQTPERFVQLGALDPGCTETSRGSPKPSRPRA